MLPLIAVFASLLIATLVNAVFHPGMLVFGGVFLVGLVVTLAVFSACWGAKEKA